MLITEKKSVNYSEAFKNANKQLHDAFSQIRDEFEDHLIGINENTNEIQANYELVCNLDQKLNKLSERLDRMEIFLQKHGLKLEEQEEYSLIKLNKREQEIFLVLYTMEEIKGAVTYLDIAKKICLPEDIVANYISNLIQKGIPIIKKYKSNQAHLRLNPRFKSLQAKENLLQIEQKRLQI